MANPLNHVKIFRTEVEEGSGRAKLRNIRQAVLHIPTGRIVLNSYHVNYRGGVHPNQYTAFSVDELASIFSVAKRVQTAAASGKIKEFVDSDPSLSFERF